MAVTLKIYEAEEYDEARYVITILDEDAGTASYYFIFKKELNALPQKDDMLTLYYIGQAWKYYGIDINGKPQFRADEFEEREVAKISPKTKNYFFKGVPLFVKHQKIIEVGKGSEGYSLVFDDGYGWYLRFEDAKRVPQVGDMFTGYTYGYGAVIGCDINGEPQFRREGFEEKDACLPVS